MTMLNSNIFIRIKYFFFVIGNIILPIIQPRYSRWLKVGLHPKTLDENDFKHPKMLRISFFSMPINLLEPLS